VGGSSTATAMATESTTSLELTATSRPRLRGLSHQLAFFCAVPLGIVPVVQTRTAEGRASAIVYAATVAFMFGASGLVIVAVGLQYASMAIWVLPDN
jgi:hypothetical protein